MDENTVPHEIWLDLLKETQLTPEEVDVRVGEGGTQTIRAHITKGGEKFTIPERWTGSVTWLTAADNTKTQACEVDDDCLVVTLAEEMLTDEGTCKRAYFKLTPPDAENATTEDYKQRILGSTTTGDTVRSWDGQLDALVLEFQATIESIKQHELERVENEQTRISQENLRQKQEDRREKQERQRQTAEKKREQASQTAVKNAEAATENANTAASTATTAAQHADEATEASKTQTQAAKEATDAATEATTKSEEQTALAKEATDAANAAAQASKDQTALAETATERANTAAETAETGEEARVEAEKARVTAEEGRDTAEQARVKAEGERDTAEKARAEADTDRAGRQTANDEAQAKNDEAQAANDLAQSKNNAQQEANNQAAYNHQFITLTDGQYDPDTRKPTIEDPASGPVYRVPKEAPSETNKYDEWYWAVTTEGAGEWEAWTATQIAEAPAIPTDKIDRIVSGEEVGGDEVVKTGSLSYYDKAVKQRTETAISGAVSAQAATQKTKDDAQDTAISAAKKAGDDAASALDDFKAEQGTKDEGQDSAIEKAQKRADEAYDHVPDVVTSEAVGILPAFPSEGGPFYPTAEGGELKGWLAIPVFAEGRAGLVPGAPSPDEGEKVLLNTGWGDYKGGGMPDYRGLKAAIAAAEKAKTDTKVAGGDDYDFGTEVAPQQALSNLEAAIATAQAVMDAYENPETTQETLDAAAQAMEGAIETFKASVSPLQPDTSGLTEQEGRYTQLKSSVVTSADGKDVPFGSMWVTSAEQQAADTALQAARTAVAAAKKQSEITSAVSTLDSALDTYESARKTATKDTAALDRAIEAANAAKQDVSASDSEGSDLPSGSKYVTTAQMKALTDAISAAQGAKASASTQAAIDKATSDLTSATSTFSAQVKTNWSAPSSLSGASADDLARICDLAKEDGDTYYQKYKGQTFTITMQNTTYSAATITVRCDDAANMDAVAGGKCGLHFTIIQGLKTQQMNSSATTSGGYSGSAFYKNVLPNIIKALPQEFQDRLEDLYVDVNLASSGTTITPVAGKMHLVTMKQWFGQKNIDAASWTSTCRAWWDKEEEWLKWNSEHDTNNDRIIKNDAGSADHAWTSSVYDTSNFGFVSSNGTPNYGSARNQYVPALGFSLTNG